MSRPHCLTGVIVGPDHMPSFQRTAEGWLLTVAAEGFTWEVETSDIPDRDLEAYLLRMARRVRTFREGNQGGPTPETVRHRDERVKNETGS
jgi:hypothetical protein